MNFFKYLLNNRLWIMVGFIVLCGIFAIVWARQGNAGIDLKIMGFTVMGIVVAFLIGNLITWKRSR